MVRLKVVKVNNPKNVLVQIPKMVTDLWSITGIDTLDICLSSDAESIIIKKHTEAKELVQCQEAQ